MHNAHAYQSLQNLHIKQLNFQLSIEIEFILAANQILVQHISMQ